jgi:predicted nucleotidyltransferase
VNATSGDLLANYLSGDDTYFTLAQIAEDLSGLLGKQVDLHVRKSLHPFLRDKVLSQAETLYVAA